VNRLEELRLDAQAYLELARGAKPELADKYFDHLSIVRQEIEAVRRESGDLFRTQGAEVHG